MSADHVSNRVFFFTFLIWTAYGVLIGIGKWPAAVALGLVGGFGLVLFQARHGMMAKLMDWVLVGYFAMAATATFALQSVAFAKYSPLIIWLLYAVASWGSILIGHPFSLRYGRETTPSEHWQHPVFLRAAYVISSVWAGAFAINALLVAIALHAAANPVMLGIVVPVLMMIAASTFTSRYTQMLRARANPE